MYIDDCSVFGNTNIEFVWRLNDLDNITGILKPINIT